MFYLKKVQNLSKKFHFNKTFLWFVTPLPQYLPAFCRLSHSIFCLEIESIDNFDKFHRKAKLKISQWVVKILNEIY